MSIATPTDSATRRTEAERVADVARDRLSSAVDQLAAATDPAEMRDLAIAVTVLAESVEKLDGVARRQAVHEDVLRRWRDSISTVLSQLTGREREDLRHGSFRFDQGEIVVDRGEGEPGIITERAFWDLLEGTLHEIEDRVGEGS